MYFEEVKSFMDAKLKKELPAELTYHNHRHVFDVYEKASMLAKMENISEGEEKLLLIAVLFHDSGFIISQTDHEMYSCQLAAQHLPAFGINPEQLQCINGMIMATKVPQNPQNLLEKIICDADLDYLGRPDFWEIGALLFAELKGKGILNTSLEWNRMQVAFLEKHRYFTASAHELRQATKMEHLKTLKEMIEP